MYELKTLLPQFDIKLPTCMYELRNVSLSAGSAPCPEVSVLSPAAVAKIRDAHCCEQEKFTVTVICFIIDYQKLNNLASLKLNNSH